MTQTADAVVVGAGHHGLVAANILADHGWDVVVLEAADAPGGAVRTGELTRPGFHHDHFSSFYPLGAASPVLAGLHLEDHGLRWRRAPIALANPTPAGPTAVISTDIEVTAASLDAFAAGDGGAWRAMFGRWMALHPHLVATLMAPFPPLRAAVPLVARLLAAGGPQEPARFARFALLPARRLGEEHFAGAGARLLIAGNAGHTDVGPDSAGSGMYGWLLAMLAQHVGFPVPEGGAGRLTDALVARMVSRGAQLRCGERVVAIDVEGGRATGARTAGGTTVRARRAVLADVAAPALLGGLVGPEHLPASTVRDVARFEWDAATVKVDWALSEPIPWSDDQCRRAGTVHLADSVDHLADVANAVATGRVPHPLFCVVGQQSMTDPTRMPTGTETAWAYAHLPRRPRAPLDLDGVVATVERRIEALAPGFAGLVLGRHVFTPARMEDADANLVGGAVSGGTSRLHQQAVWRPVPGQGRATTPVAGLFLASASAHPGGGVHGACGANAARAALAHSRRHPRRRPW
ncbi:MAG: phytoene desaturase family protein [Acidimicrobiales bacterium]